MSRSRSTDVAAPLGIGSRWLLILLGVLFTVAGLGFSQSSLRAPRAHEVPPVASKPTNAPKPSVTPKPSDLCQRLRGRNISSIQMYHISKCGGTTVNDLFRDAFTPEGKAAIRVERENSCDPAYGCEKPQDVFILGTIRSPFAFYVSYWQMVIKGSNHSGCPHVPGCDPFEYTGCVGTAARKVPDVFDIHNLWNRTSFGRFLKLLLATLPLTGCDFTMSGIYKKLMLPRSGGPPVHDGLVRTEEFYPTIRAALKEFECSVKGAVDWQKFEQRMASGYNFNRGRMLVPYHCYYDDAAVQLVRRHDDLILQTYNYSFAQFRNRSEKMGDCRNVRI